MTGTRAPENQSSQRWLVGDLTVDFENGSVKRDGKDLDLPVLSFRLLKSLLERAPEVVSPDVLMDEAWGDVVIGEETVKQRVKLLRQALGEDGEGSRYVETVRGRGYRIACDVTPSTIAIASEYRSRRKNVALGLVVLLATFVSIVVIKVTSMPGAENVTPTQAFRVIVTTPEYLTSPASSNFFAEGLSTHLIAALATRPDIAIMPKSLLMAQDFESLRAAGAEAVLGGSVQVVQDEVIVTLTLVELDREGIIWASTYSEKVNAAGHPAAQRLIAEAVRSEMTLHR